MEQRKNPLMLSCYKQTIKITNNYSLNERSAKMALIWNF